MANFWQALLTCVALNVTSPSFAVEGKTLSESDQLGCLPVDIKSISNMVVDFKNSDEWLLWRPINDAVMGGKSQGSMTASDGTGIFSGNISLANNGGFSSVVRAITPLKSGVESLLIDVEGDGFTYQLRAVVYINGYRIAYKHNFQTVSQHRQQLRMSLSDFKATFRGRTLANVPTLASENIAEIGLLIINKSEGPFHLNLFSIATCANSKDAVIN